MAIKGDRKRQYQKLYMRRRRADQRVHSLAFITQRLKEFGFAAGPDEHPRPVLVSLQNENVALELDRARYDEWRQSA